MSAHTRTRVRVRPEKDPSGTGVEYRDAVNPGKHVEFSRPESGHQWDPRVRVCVFQKKREKEKRRASRVACSRKERPAARLMRPEKGRCSDTGC